MGILDDLGVGKKNVPLEKARQNMLFMEQQFQNLCRSLGLLVYEKSEQGEENTPAYQELLHKIKRTKANHESFYANWLQLQGLMRCANCYKEIPYGSVFCSNCGKKAGVREGEESNAGAVVMAEKEHCQNCGAEMEADAAFCTSCGTKKA